MKLQTHTDGASFSTNYDDQKVFISDRLQPCAQCFMPIIRTHEEEKIPSLYVSNLYQLAPRVVAGTQNNIGDGRRD
eukprot:scaffold109724_cov10-Prasinocladus_malaysianus.AAC.1